MLNELIEKLRSLVPKREVFDPGVFDDPVANLTEWTPAKRGGTNLRTHKLVTVDSGRVEFRASTGAYLFYAVFLLIGLGVLVAFSTIMLRASPRAFNPEFILPILIGAVFFLIGAGLLRSGTNPIVFDKTSRSFWKGCVAPDQVFDKSRIKAYAEFDQIHAIQLLSEYCRGNKTSYHSYELNLVLENGERINVIDHGNKSKLVEDAQTLAAFLEKPLWDTIG